MRKIKKVLIANRGEIVMRIQRTLDRLGIASVVVYDERERTNQYVLRAAEACSLGSGTLAETFLDGKRLIAIAQNMGCDAVHPGYGFLSENAEFAAACIEAGLVFIGPDPAVIGLMGQKDRAIASAEDAGLPVIPRITGSPEELIRAAENGFFPCLVKASAGGGGKGMHRVDNREQLEETLRRSIREASGYFGDGTVYLEKYLPSPRHIEVQILGDRQGNTVHLFERECTVQRRFQKIIEEAPSASLSETQRNAICNDAVTLARSVNYTGAGTVEFLLDSQGQHYFLEMNTRIQVEHGATELVTGIDIVEEQMAVAEGRTLSERAMKATITGHAIEARIYAEDPANGFRPSPGTIDRVCFPEGENLRIETALEDDYYVFSDFDPMLAKVIVHADTREIAIGKLAEVLDRTIIQGINHNTAFLAAMLRNSQFRDNVLTTHFVEDTWPDGFQSEDYSAEIKSMLLVAAAYLSLHNFPQSSQKDVFGGYWRWHHSIELLSGDNSTSLIIVRDDEEEFRVRTGEEEYTLDHPVSEQGLMTFGYRDLEYSLVYSFDRKTMACRLSLDNRIFVVSRRDFLPVLDIHRLHEHLDDSDTIHAPLNGKVIKILQAPNGIVRRGEVLLIIESMKMENEVRMPRDASLAKLHVQEGQRISEGDLLAELT